MQGKWKKICKRNACKIEGKLKENARKWKKKQEKWKENGN